MVRLKNTKYNITQLTAPATVHDDERGRVQKYPIGYYVLTDQVTNKTRVISPQEYASMFETVSGTVRPVSAAYTAVQLTAYATVSVGSEGRAQRGVPGDWLVTNNATGEAKVYTPAQYAAGFE